MQINNLLQMNDWEIKKFLKAVLAIQLAVWGMIGLDAIGLQIPIIRQLIGFTYLTFVPGIIILRILKLHKLCSIETLLYTVGLSIATLMFTGLFMNTVYPFFGISRPISIMPLIITISILVLILCILIYVRDKDHPNPSFIDIGDVLSPPTLFLCLIPFLAIFGTYLVNFHHNNILLMFLIIILALIPILIAFDKFIPKNLYPLAVFVIAISLLYHRSLISMYLWGTDIHHEHYVCNLTMWNSYWDSTIPITINAMLSIVMLAPIFSSICGMSITWIFKIIYPLVFALVPLGLYRVFQMQTNDKIAFLSCFFFMSTGPFYTIMLWVARQQIAELFLVLLILLMVSKDMNRINRSFLLIIFGFSLVVSHYGVSYIYMFSLISVWLILVLMGNPAIQKVINDFYSKFCKHWNREFSSNLITLKAIKNRTISPTFIQLFVVFTLIWYIYVSSSSAFNVIVRIGDQIASNIFDLFKPGEVEGLYYIMGATLSPLHSITRYLHLLTQFFISAGLLASLLKYSGTKFEEEYSAFSLTFFGICLASLAIPFTSTTLGTTRAYLITLFFLAPFCAIGCITVFRMLCRVSGASWTDQRVINSLKVLSIFLAIFLLFNTGLVYEVAKDDPSSISLNTTIKHPRFYFNEQEAHGAQWVANTAKKESEIYAGDFGRFILWDFVHDKNKVRIFTNETKDIPPKCYIFMGLLNVRDDEVVVVQRTPAGFFRDYPKLSNSTFYNKIIIYTNKIYDTGDAQAYMAK
jgi:uncharacterized membrane protein